ncbi:MAG TPA: 2-oxoglutarate dehydrogenase E1 component, partial [Thiotrichales bacterium]|nr:2-oxoglutarate dehydrogenase E1 component [Thiotrichales bacterium]
MADKIPPDMQKWWRSSSLYGGSAPWLEAMYETYLNQPDSLDANWRAYFDSLPESAGHNGAQPGDVEISPKKMRDYFLRYSSEKNKLCRTSQIGIEHERKQVQVLQLINAYRFRGHQIANTNPLRDRRITRIAELSLGFHGLSEDDFDLTFDTGSLAGPETLSL